MARRADIRRRTWVRLALLVVTAIALLTLDARGSGGVLDTARGAALDLLGPVRTFGDWVVGPFRNAWRGVVSFDELEAENAQLRSDLAEVRASVLRVGELERDRQALLALLDASDETAAIPRITARVISASVSNFERTIELARGHRDGIRVNMPVESGAGLVGRVVGTSATRSRVELLSDPNFDAGVRIVRSGDDGLVSGRGPGRDLEVSYIELESVVIPGETVVTSGFPGSEFPAGLLVGTVTDVVPDAARGAQRATVRPAADLERLRWVRVLLYVPEVPEPVVVDRLDPPAESPVDPQVDAPDSGS
ncbi:rod shape-determining protein MreC [Candidatus Poriferisodalis sp.]|uniref:rod shape-determining protein MreC n=1 Tax=Candidatus Poriferisodalis sp. TaxID=3101277 RepID=UPI003B0224F5